jgi:hypothetical protein
MMHACPVRIVSRENSFLTHDVASGGRCKVLQEKGRTEPD